MKKYIVMRLIVLVLVITGVLLCVGSYLMLHITYTGFYSEASGQIAQVEEILLENDVEAENLQEELKIDFLIRAKAAAYMIQHNQDIIYDIDELNNIAALLQIDEIHLFTPEGEIYSGNVTDYYGYTFDSGEQMNFFAPLLDDYSLELAQDVTPNTAEGKDMQYVAVWSEDRQHIVQIGIEPLRLIAAMEATELAYVFSRLTPVANTMFFAVDISTNRVICSTNQIINGNSLSDFGLSDFDEEDAKLAHNAKIDGVYGHVLLRKQSNDIYIGYYQSHPSIYNSVLLNIALIIAISFVVAIVMIVLIYFMLDRVVLHRLSKLEEGMELIASGDLEYKMDVGGLPEFDALSSNVNYMVKQIVESSRKFATIFEHVNVPIAMYECKANAVIATGKLADILHISNERFAKEFNSPKAFLALIEDTMANAHSSENNLYILQTEFGDRYLKIMRYQEGESDWGLIVDSTVEINEKYSIKKERDLDFLTGLLGKRAFFEQLESLSKRQQVIKKAAVFMFDLDNLKYVNDTWGHETGDSFISEAANILHKHNYSNKISTRLSGDEFAMLLYGADDYSEVEIWLEQIKSLLEKAYIKTPTGEEHKVSVSVGYALYPEQAQTLNICLSHADKAMYKAKSKKKGSIEKYDGPT